jgi:hypothetical protein
MQPFVTRNDCTKSVFKIEGTKVTNRDPQAINGLKTFYLPTDFKSEVSVNPRDRKTFSC